jgi:hypothetical protein
MIRNLHQVFGLDLFIDLLAQVAIKLPAVDVLATNGSMNKGALQNT